jgi:hypothetical protein
MTSWRERGREGEQGLQDLYGLYYLAESVPNAKNTHFSSKTGGRAGCSEVKYTNFLDLNRQSIKNVSSTIRKTTHNIWDFVKTGWFMKTRQL